MSRIVVITGAYGYLGARIRAALDAEGWTTVALARKPRHGDRAVRWQLGDGLPAELASSDALVHCAYDMTARLRRDVWRINVGGSETLIRSARSDGVERILALSSMSAYPGTRQVYGQAKLAIEAATLDAGGIAVRPGLVYGDNAGGMIGTLDKLARLPVTPVLGGSARQYPVWERDFTRVVTNVLNEQSWSSRVLAIAQPAAVSFRDLMTGLALRHGRRCRPVSVPWQLVYAAVRLGEVLYPQFPLRSDSLAGLVHPAPSVPRSDFAWDLPETLRTFNDWTRGAARVSGP